MIVTLTDAREIGYCCAGLRRWFERQGLSWDKFKREGMPAEQFRATGDAMAIRLIEHVEAREKNSGR